MVYVKLVCVKIVRMTKQSGFGCCCCFLTSSKQGFCLVSKQARDFPGSPVVKDALHWRGHRFDPW